MEGRRKGITLSAMSKQGYGRSFATSVFVVSFVLLQQVFPATGQVVISGCSPTVNTVSEGTANGSSVFTLTATISGGAPNVSWGAENEATMTLFSLTNNGHSPGDTSRWTADVILIAELDRDFQPAERVLVFSATTSTNATGFITCRILITDINDNPPSFLELPYNIRVPENTAIGAVLLAGISARDPDSNGQGAIELIDALYPDDTVRDIFGTTKTVVDSGEVMNITLLKPLDRETRSFYSFRLMARDGLGLNTTTEVTVTVTDVQDTPPFFLLDSYRAAIREKEPQATSVIKVSAEDGDRDPPNSISYSIVNGSASDYFTINNVTGQITSLRELDRDNQTMVGSESSFELIVRATENNDTWPQYGNITTDVLVLVMVLDVNDHRPTFGSSDPYTAFVREDIPLDSLIYFDGEGYIFVNDIDQGRNSYFNLTVERDGVPWPALEATPSEAFSEALVLLRVKDADVFRNSPGTHITLQLVAREISTAERFSSTAVVVITVEKEPEAPATAAPVESKGLTESDYIVFIIGFLVIFNIIASVLIIYFMRRRSSEPRQGLVRKGSKYYVNGVERKRQTGATGVQNAAVTYGEDTVMVEVEGKDRCDVVPLSAVLSETGKSFADNSALTSSTASLIGRNHGRPSNLEVNYRDLLENGTSLSQTDRNALLPNEALVARSATNPDDTRSSVVTVADVNVSVTSSSGAAPPAAASSATAEIPNLSKAKRNVSSPQSPALSFANPAHKASSAAPGASNYQLDFETTAFPSYQATSTSSLPTSGNAAAGGGARSPSSSAKTVRAPAKPATSSATGSTSELDTILEPVTRFSSKGVVSTTIAAVPQSPPTTPRGASGQTESGNDRRDSSAARAQTSTDLLY